jgi:hypothetical protein
MTKYPKITVQLSGEDGNIFAIMGRISRALRNGKVDRKEIDQFVEEVTSTDSYPAALAACSNWVTVN